MRMTISRLSLGLSRPTRARGLKQAILAYRLVRSCVAPHAGAWIETLQRVSGHHRHCPSRPTRARGLKLSRGKIKPD